MWIFPLSGERTKLKQLEDENTISPPEPRQNQGALTEKSVGTLAQYPVPSHMQSAYADLSMSPDSLPVTRKLTGRFWACRSGRT